MSSISIKLACLISARNLGDAVGHGLALERLAEHGYARRFLVWTKPESAFLFERIPNCDLVTSRFPIGTGSAFKPSDLLALWTAARAVRRLAPEVTLDLVGDFRERLLARLVGSPRHCHIGWAHDHAFTHIIRNPFGTGKPVVTVPATVPNVYAAHDLFVKALCPHLAPVELGPAPAASATAHIGLHPFASQACKLWPLQNWETLAGTLLADGHRLTAFAAPTELTELRRALGRHLQHIAVVTSTLREFDAHVPTLDLMVGLDSFSVHMAHRHGVRSIMLNAGNPAMLWRPPEGSLLSAGSLCAHYPCYNVPRCDDGKRFVCIRGLGVEAVRVEISRTLGHLPSVVTKTSTGLPK